MGVEVRPTPNMPKKFSISLSSGRIITFDDNKPTNCVDSEDIQENNYNFVPVGPCKMQPEINKYIRKSSGKKKKCGNCGNKGGDAMRCDLIFKHDGGKCIRCKGETIGTWRSCDKPGLGDRLMRLFTKWGFRHCEACANRRQWLNEFDRTIFGYFWRKFHGVQSK